MAEYASEGLCQVMILPCFYTGRSQDLNLETLILDWKKIRMFGSLIPGHGAPYQLHFVMTTFHDLPSEPNLGVACSVLMNGMP